MRVIFHCSTRKPAWAASLQSTAHRGGAHLRREVKLEPEIDLFGDGGADYQLQPRAAAPDRAQDTSYFDQPESYADLPALPTGAAITPCAAISD